MSRMVQVKNGEITQYGLPKVGTLKDGSTVSGYDLLMLSDPELAREEGWLPLEDIQPIYNEDTQYIINDGFEILEDKVMVKYRIVEIPEPEIIDEYVDDEKVAMAEAIIDLESRLSALEGGK
ncbi:hypothetical protein [Tissierella sp.]|uniref:hypothetical protein n=1 Tax=Tissierella sp. TaxID=41274 RepID=UPI003069F38E